MLEEPKTPEVAQSPSVYGRPFWLTYVSNFLMMVAVALLFRYANFVTELGGNEWHLGWIVGIGMVGSLLMRLVLGAWIDRYGPRLVWLGSVLVFSAVLFGHLAVTTYFGPAIYVLRIVFCSAIAGFFGASITFVCSRAPSWRMAEMIGVLGTSGFLGIIGGTQLGDMILGTEVIEPWQVDRMFLLAGTIGLMSFVVAYFATWGSPRPKRTEHPPLFQLLLRYGSPMVVMIGVGMGIGLSMPGVFVAAYARELNIPTIGLFFGVYAPAAFITRVFTSRLPSRIGTTPMILIGMAGLVVSPLLLLLVDSKWMLVIPGAFYGFSHAMLFPSIMAAGTQTFPREHRGLATTVMMGTWDAGALIGSPLAGAIIYFSTRFGLPAYPSMFVALSGLLAIMATTFAVSEFGRARRVAVEELAVAAKPASCDVVAEEPAVAKAAPTDQTVA